MVHVTVGQKEEWYIDQDSHEAHGKTEQIVKHNSYAANTTAQSLVGNIKSIDSDTHYNAA